MPGISVSPSSSAEPSGTLSVEGNSNAPSISSMSRSNAGPSLSSMPSIEDSVSVAPNGIHRGEGCDRRDRDIGRGGAIISVYLMVSMTHREVTHLGIYKIDLLNVVP